MTAPAADVDAVDIPALEGPDTLADGERALIHRLALLVAEFTSPDGEHRALRSAFSRRGTCEIYPNGQHSGLCLDMFEALREATDYLEAAEAEHMASEAS